MLFTIGEDWLESKVAELKNYTIDGPHLEVPVP
jgi:hypothetical protein